MRQPGAKFGEFHSLFQIMTRDKLDIVGNENGVLTFNKSKSGSIKTLDKWFEAFHVFSAV